MEPTTYLSPFASPFPSFLPPSIPLLPVFPSFPSPASTSSSPSSSS